VDVSNKDAEKKELAERVQQLEKQLEAFVDQELSDEKKQYLKILKQIQGSPCILCCSVSIQS